VIRVLFVCLGNICRSPMAEGIFQHLVNQAGLSDQIEIDSTGTHTWRVGGRAHRGTRNVLRRHNITYNGRARQVTPADLCEADYVVVMDADNVYDLRRLDRRVDLEGKLHMLLDFAPPGSPREVPDPYFDGAFEYVYDLIEVGCRGLLDHIRTEHGL
jgi:protein-tyrosine phosphatase